MQPKLIPLTYLLFWIHQSQQFSSVRCDRLRCYMASDLCEPRFSCANIQFQEPCQSRIVLFSILKKKMKFSIKYSVINI